VHVVPAVSDVKPESGSDDFSLIGFAIVVRVAKFPDVGSDR
jgi:hypothetical protein